MHGRRVSMRQTRPGMAITDLLGIAAVLALVAALGIPTLERARELSKRMVCAVNLKALSGAAEVYADANKGQWMSPGYKKNQSQDGIAYLCNSGAGDPQYTIACVGFERSYESKSETPMNPAAFSTALSTTRAYWMLVRSGDVSVKQFICPSSLHDVPDPTKQIDTYYDFREYRNISYGYLVPFGPIETQPRQGRDHRIIFAADKGPNYVDIFLDPYSAGPNGAVLQLGHDPRFWRPFNSPNHGGSGNGDGQNAMFADGRVEFHRIPAIGMDGDNIYTLMIDEWNVTNFNRIHGETPHDSAAINPYPGKEAFGQCPNCFSTTDSLIYP